MTDTPKKQPFDILPHLASLSKDVLFGEVWEEPGLSKRDRSLATCAILAAMYRTAELDYHMRLAMTNGVTEEELKALITHVAFYAGWPSAMNAGRVAVDVLDGGDA
ncbi:carboxymuconolactone decarboxylase family protein [Sinirhodobacter sp. WL0062]|uniref:Carboxymuconolactone decarboxylase family protein n=1 Tax=Rhodobacter flavimaris TaxID=2907145 RepID=A0ABS8YZI9_9RHOB|nr:carboxymuconolactone decarboxylase family protein [Sinirhodobacter sp. WL0062]MCE5975211.1 carboxymuconolactone decarboxylase family protein [Sinirhodobacter sp. WL0062]